ncbi:MAG: Tfp pilus assembly protein FimT/FimU [Phycisphaerales bacterium]
MTRGFTLIEVLLTVTLLAGMSAVLLVPMGRSTAASRLEGAAHRVQDADRRARLIATRRGPVHLKFPVGGVEIVAADAADGDPPLLRADLGPAIQLDGPEIVVVDRHGRTRDYAVSVGDGTRHVSWSVHGLLGLTVEDAPR